MGTWGPGLYQNDVSDDVKTTFLDQLRRGKTGEEITNMLIEQNQDVLSDSDDACDFWFALADTQWNLGRLTPSVRDRALECLDSVSSLKCWKDSSAKQLQKRTLVLNDLRFKLNSPQPEEKIVKQYRLYQCLWKIGDIFYMPFEGEFAQRNGYIGQYILIKKVAEELWWPGHMIPVVHLKVTSNGRLPESKEEYDQLDYVQIEALQYSARFLWVDEKELRINADPGINLDPETDEYGFLPIYRIGLITTSKRSLPSNLKYWCHYPNAVQPPNEFVPYYRDSIFATAWKDLAKISIERFFAHNRRQLSIYSASKQDK